VRNEIKPFWGSYAGVIRAWTERAEKQSLIRRIWDKDVSVWTRDPEGQEEAKNRLGWLTSANQMKSAVAELEGFREEIKEAGFKTILLLGMGGSSLAPEVFQKTFGNRPGFPELQVLDSTDPAQIREVEDKIKIDHTLFIVSSKSGGTIELVSLFKYFYQKARATRGEKTGTQFVAITDPGTALEESAKKHGFRKIFLNSPDIGGRFSALSYFGLVPAALIGADIGAVLDSAEKMMIKTSAKEPFASNAAIALGIGMTVLAEQKRDKLTFVSSKRLEPFGDWAEQLVAESTGKEGLGVIPIVGEELGEPELYGEDRFFVGLLFESERGGEIETRLKELEKRGHPVLLFCLRDAADIGGEFFRWEMATAIGCALLKVNAFDQPDVQSAKDKTKLVLKKLEKGEKLSIPVSETTALEPFWESAKSRDYVAILAFLPARDDITGILKRLRTQIRNQTRMAVTLGIGPRYLHSTGQLHKGGSDRGLFILITAEQARNLPIPDDSYGFAELETAQAVGDFEALSSKGRRVVHFRISSPESSAAEELSTRLVESLKTLV
jgi:glucose-6-phosphate isomerase